MRALAVAEQLALFETPIVGLMPIDVATANARLVEWGHRLGPCNRPFGQRAYALALGGRPVSVAISASVVSATVAGFRRNEVVECARLCSDPAEGWATRVMLRLWREACAPLWPFWTVLAAVSYSHNAHHRGDLYRFDGWEKAAENCGSHGGGTWSRKRYATDAVRGSKTLWVWRYGR